MKKVIISIGDESHKLVEDKQEFNCEDCSLFKTCTSLETGDLCCLFSEKLSHFEKVEDDE